MQCNAFRRSLNLNPFIPAALDTMQWTNLFKSRTIVVLHLGNESKLEMRNLHGVARRDSPCSSSNFIKNEQRTLDSFYLALDVVLERLRSVVSRIRDSEVEKKWQKLEWEFQKTKAAVEKYTKQSTYFWSFKSSFILYFLLPPTISLSIKKEHPFSFWYTVAHKKRRSAKKRNFSCKKKTFANYIFLLFARLLTFLIQQENVHKNLL